MTDKIKQIKSAADTAIHSILKAVTKEDKEKAANAAVDNLTKIQTDAISTLPGWDDLLDEDEEMEHEVEEKE